MQISVIICTHNPRQNYLSRVLEALRNQTLSTDAWELLLVDNASLEPLTSETWDLSWHPRARHIREGELGVAVARRRGIRDALGEILVFVDDDNILHPDYLFETLRIAREWPQLGVWGCSIAPEFEASPPHYLCEFLAVLALREVKNPCWSNVVTCDEAEPWGAGMCVRVAVAAEYCRITGKSTMQIGSVGNLLRGEDTEICYVACKLGFGMGLFPSLKMTHLIPKERLEENYIVKLTEGIQTSLHLLAFKWRGIVPSSPFTPLSFLRLCLYFINKSGIHRRMYLASIRSRIMARRLIAANVIPGSPDFINSTFFEKSKKYDPVWSRMKRNYLKRR